MSRCRKHTSYHWLCRACRAERRMASLTGGHIQSGSRSGRYDNSGADQQMLTAALLVNTTGQDDLSDRAGDEGTRTEDRGEVSGRGTDCAPAETTSHHTPPTDHTPSYTPPPDYTPSYTPPPPAPTTDTGGWSGGSGGGGYGGGTTDFSSGGGGGGGGFSDSGGGGGFSG